MKIILLQIFDPLGLKLTHMPLAASQNLTIDEYPTVDEASFAAVLNKHLGEEISICGPSNTVPLLVNYFTGSSTPSNLKEDEYDKTYIISKSTSGNSTILKLSLK